MRRDFFHENNDTFFSGFSFAFFLILFFILFFVLVREANIHFQTHTIREIANKFDISM